MSLHCHIHGVDERYLFPVVLVASLLISVSHQIDSEYWCVVELVYSPQTIQRSVAACIYCLNELEYQ